MKILGTGLSGLVGSRIVELLPDFEFRDLSRKYGVDVSIKEQIFEAISNSSARTILHLAAFTGVDDAEKEKSLQEKSTVWQVNVLGTKNVLEACEKFNKKIIYLSTDMVFSGDKELPDKYSENDQTGAANFYAKTKEEAEKFVEKAACPWVILRIAYPYRAKFEKEEYVRFFKRLLEEGKKLTAVCDHYFTPTFIDDLSDVIKLIIKNDLTGKFHAGGNEIVSPYEAAIKISKVFNLNKDLIEKTTREIFFKDKAPRAYNLALNNDKIEKLGIKLSTFEEGLNKIKKQLII